LDFWKLKSAAFSFLAGDKDRDNLDMIQQETQTTEFKDCTQRR
jgi:hypothetical protein